MVVWITDVNWRVLRLDLVIHVGNGECVRSGTAHSVETLGHDEVPVERGSRLLTREVSRVF